MDSSYLSVLLVFNEAHEQTRVRERLCRRGHQVCAVTTATAARRQAAERQFDVVVCDTALPDGDGVELGRELSQASATRAIAVSDTVSPADVRRSLSAGLFAHVSDRHQSQPLPELIEVVGAYPVADEHR